MVKFYQIRHSLTTKTENYLRPIKPIFPLLFWSFFPYNKHSFTSPFESHVLVCYFSESFNQAIMETKLGKDEHKSSGLRQVGLLTTIPMVLLAGLLVGFFFGSLVDRSFNTNPWGKVVLSALGIIASIKQTIGLIQDATKDNE